MSYPWPTVAVMVAIDYARPGPLTDLSGVPDAALATLPGDPAAICRLAQHLVIQPADARRLGLPDQRFADNDVRRTDLLVASLLRLDPAPLDVARDPRQRVVGTCRHFAVLTCALLRHRGIAARARCGFATYFQAGLGLDHWVVEHRDPDGGRWVRLDPEVIGRSVVPNPHDLAPGQFFTGGEAWAAFRAGRIVADRFGVDGTDNFGPAEIRGNAIRDLAALNKIELLPWDEWGRMAESYRGETGADYDELIDTVAAVCAAADPSDLADLHATQELRAPLS
jgi:hypothetical protein